MTEFEESVWDDIKATTLLLTIEDSIDMYWAEYIASCEMRVGFTGLEIID